MILLIGIVGPISLVFKIEIDSKKQDIYLQVRREFNNAIISVK